MSPTLHPSCRTQLCASLTEQLSHADVQHGMFLTPRTSTHLFLSQTILPQHGPLHGDLQSFVSETPLVDFVTGVLARELHERDQYQSDGAPVLLSTLSGYSDLSVLAERLVTAFESLPWRYTITTPLPPSFSRLFCSHVKSADLSETVSIRIGGTLTATHPLTSGVEPRDRAIAGGGIEGLLRGSRISWAEDRAYLQVQTEGFIGKFTQTEPLVRTISVIRAFYGLALALRVLKPQYSYEANPRTEKAYIHRLVEDQWIVEEAHELELHHSKAIRDLVLDDLDGVLNDGDKRAYWMQKQLAAIGAVFHAGDRAKHIQLGAQWLFESHCGGDELLQFVQAAVVMEILLGDKASSDLTGLGELLANRCAYLIATTHSQRTTILEDFRSIYDVRSKIVHRGKSRLALLERRLFNKLQWMCRRVLQQEVSLLHKDME